MTRTDWIQTYTGKQVFPTEPDPGVVTIEDIAHSLACQARFAGHTIAPYSVAQHSVIVCELVCLNQVAIREAKDPNGLALVALLHDAAEAYIQDLVRPIKRQVFGQTYRDLEAEWCLAIADALGLGLGMQLANLPACVKVADNVALATEARDLFGTKSPAEWGIGQEPHQVKIRPFDDWRQAKWTFLDVFQAHAKAWMDSHPARKLEVVP